jgi:hypothetical protein
VDRRRWLVDLDDLGARVHESAELRREDRDKRLRGRDPRFVDLAAPVREPARQRVRPGQRDLERPRRPRTCGRVLGDDSQPVGRSDPLEHGKSMEPIVRTDAEPPVCRDRLDTGQVAVELGGEEAGPAHLAIADHVDPGLLLVADREVDAVGEELGEIRPPELAALGGRDPVGEPARVRVRPDDTRQERLPVHRLRAHRLTSANANARAGLSTKKPRRTVASIPRSSIAALNSRSK